MTKILIAYGTTEGQTAQIADHLAGAIRGRGVEVEALDLKHSKDVSVAGYDAVIIGGSASIKRTSSTSFARTASTWSVFRRRSSR